MNRLSKQQIVDYVHQWGSGAVIESLLNPACHIFSTTNVTGLIGYYTNRKCSVVFGDPVCAPEQRASLVAAFHQFCDSHKKNAIYLVTTKDFARWMRREHSSAFITFGSELYLNPQSDPLKQCGKAGITLRGKVRNAHKNGVTISEYTGKDLLLEQEMHDVAANWLGRRQGPQIYISHVRLFEEREKKRWFYAMHEDWVVGVVILNKVKNGWALDRVMTGVDAPQGTSEMLVISIMEVLREEGCQFLTLGAMNGATLGEIGGFGRYTSLLIPRYYKVALKLFKLDSRCKYWEKFHPEKTPAYIVFKKPNLGLYEARGLMKALHVSMN